MNHVVAISEANYIMLLNKGHKIDSMCDLETLVNRIVTDYIKGDKTCLK